MPETLTILLAAHLLADFVLQPDWMVQRKRRPAPFLLHLAIVLVLTAALLGALPWRLLFLTVGAHGVMDALKIWAMRGPAWTELGKFALDQQVHAATAILLAALFPATAADGFWLRTLSPEQARWYLAALTVVSGAVVCILVGGVVIGIVIKPLLEEINTGRPVTEETQRTDAPGTPPPESPADLEGLRRGGRYIGWLERALVLLLVLAGQAGGVGFIAAAKSILRYGDIKDPHQRRLTEYVIIGTFLSFGWALLWAMVTQWAVRHWRA